NSDGNPTSRIIGWEKQFYYDESGGVTRFPTAIANPVRHHHTESAAFNDTILTKALGSRINTEDIEKAGYVQRDNYWWLLSASSEYLDSNGFFLPNKIVDPFANTVQLSY